MVAAAAEFTTHGWTRFAADPRLLTWVKNAYVLGQNIIRDPDERAKWLQCQGTWFVGVDSLPNDPTGALNDGIPLSCAALDLATELYGPLPLHRGQLSVTWPGYPRPRQGESDAAFRYRRDRDAAHLDGLLAVGPNRRRMLRERHAYILGLPLNLSPNGASPLVVWQGSHHIIREAFGQVLQNIDQADWPDTDLTEVYQATRRKIFDTCPRIEIAARPGECYLIHRHALHGIAPWSAVGDVPDGRVIAYFRPEFTAGTRAWINLP